jgi:hypothetical protein
MIARLDSGDAMALGGNRRRWSGALLLAIALACGSREEVATTPAEPAPPAATSPAAAGLESLRPLVGKYPRDVQLFDTEPLHSRLLALLGTRYTVLLLNFGTQNPLAEENGVLYAIGNKPHAGGDSAAILLLDPARDLIHVYLLDELEMAELRERDEPIALPADVQTTIENWKEMARDAE